MTLKKGFTLRKIPGMSLVIPVGENINNYKGALMLNDTAALIFELIQSGLDREAIAERMTQQYDINIEKASADIDKTFALLIEGGVAEA